MNDTNIQTFLKEKGLMHLKQLELESRFFVSYSFITKGKLQRTSIINYTRIMVS